MSDKSLIFYSIETDFISIACKLIEKMYAIRENVLFLCDNEDEISFYNSKLWTFSRLGFIPCGNKKSLPIEDANFCQTWFSTDIVFHNSPTCLLHNGINISTLNGIERFNKIIDIFSKDLIENAKTRFEQYKSSGFKTYKLWIQNNNNWISGEF